MCVCVCACMYVNYSRDIANDTALNGETHTSCRQQRRMTTVRMTYIRTPKVIPKNDVIYSNYNPQLLLDYCDTNNRLRILYILPVVSIRQPHKRRKSYCENVY